MLKSKLFVGVAVATLGLGSLLANAESKVIGQLNTSNGAVISSGASEQVINQQQTPYIQGDKVSTNNSSGASIVFAAGSGVLTISKDSMAAILAEAPTEILLNSGGVRVQHNDTETVTFDTPAGKFVVTSDSDIDAVAAFDDGEFVLVSQAGNVSVESENGDVITNVDANNAFAFTSSTGARSVDVQLLGGNNTTRTILILLGIGGAILILDDDDDPASPS